MEDAMKRLLSSMAICAVLASVVQAQIPPVAPTGFQVDIQAAYINAHWNPVSGQNTVTLSVDGGAGASGLESWGVLQVPVSLNLSQAHQFILVAYAQPSGDSSAPSVYRYVPLTINLPYQFVNSSSGGPVVQGDLFVDPDYAIRNRVYRNGNVGPKATISGQVPVLKANAYLVYGYGTIVGKSTVCAAPLIVNTPNGVWPKGKTAKVIFKNASNLTAFACNVSLQ